MEDLALRDTDLLPGRTGFIYRPQNVFWRKALFQIHLWSGVIAGLYIVAISISGSILVFETNLMDHRPHVVVLPGNTKIDYTKVVAAAQAAFPGEPLASIDMRISDRRIVTIVLGAGHVHRTVYVNAANAELLSSYVQEQRHGALLWLEDFHNELAGGRTGAIVNGIGGAILAALAVTGIVIWWPGLRNWQRALRVLWKARWARINYDLHSAVGFWTLIAVMMWGVTGAYFIFPDPVQKAFGIFQNGKAAGVSSWKPGQQLLPIGTYVDIARREAGQADLAFLYMDVFRPQGQVAAFMSRDPSVPLTLMEDVVRMDPATGKILQVENTGKWPLAERIALASYSIHFGDFGGNWSKAVWVILGLVPALLSVTGFVMWWHRVLSKKWRALSQARQKVSVR